VPCSRLPRAYSFIPGMATLASGCPAIQPSVVPNSLENSHCHPERSEGSRWPRRFFAAQILRFAQDDNAGSQWNLELLTLGKQHISGIWVPWPSRRAGTRAWPWHPTIENPASGKPTCQDASRRWTTAPGGTDRDTLGCADGVFGVCADRSADRSGCVWRLQADP